jgi:hypothetical protein
MLDQQRAGNVGGAGRITQCVFIIVGLGAVGCFFVIVGMTLLGQITAGQFFGSGIWGIALLGPFCFLRVYLLCKLKLEAKGSLYNDLVRYNREGLW